MLSAGEEKEERAMRLTDPMSSRHSLSFDEGRPRKIHEDDLIGSNDVETYSSSSDDRKQEGEKESACEYMIER